MPSGSSMPHHGVMQQQYGHGRGGMVMALGLQNQHRQEQGGHQGGGAASGYHQQEEEIHGHHRVPRNQQNLIAQHGIGNTNGAGIGMEPQQLAVATEESGQ